LCSKIKRLKRKLKELDFFEFLGILIRVLGKSKKIHQTLASTKRRHWQLKNIGTSIRLREFTQEKSKVQWLNLANQNSNCFSLK